MTLAAEESLVLVNLFSMSAAMADRFVEGWEASIADSLAAPGFRGTRLHRAIDPAAPYPVVNIARWDSASAWQDAVRAAGWLPGHGSTHATERRAVRAQPALYRVVHVTPDPQQR